MLLRGLAAQKRALQVHVHHDVPVVLGHLEEQVVPQHAGVVHQDLQAAQFSDHPGNGRIDLVGLAHVGTDADRATPGSIDLADDLTGRFFIQVEHRHLGAAGSEPAGHRGADPLRSAGDQRDSVLYSWH